MNDPSLEQAQAHRTARLVERLKEGETGFAVPKVAHEFQVPLGGFVDADEVVVPVDDEAAHVGKEAARGIVQIAEQDARGDHLRRGAVQPEALQIGYRELGFQSLRPSRGIEQPVGPAVKDQGGTICYRGRDGRILFQQGFLRDQFPRLGSFQLTPQPLGRLPGGKAGCAEIAGGRIHIGEGDAVSDQRYDGQMIGAGTVKVVLVDGGARGDHLDHAPIHDALPRPRLRHLFANGDFLACAEKACDVGSRGVPRYAAHGQTVAAGEGEVQEGRNFDRVFGEHLVEIAQPKKQNIVPVFLLNPPVLFQHGARFGHGSCIIGVDALKYNTRLV